MYNNYLISLDSFHIREVRSLSKDTDYVCLAVKVGDVMSQPQIQYMGDLGKGSDHAVSLQIPITVDNPNTLVWFNYQILNSGGGADPDRRHKTTEALITGANDLFSYYPGVDLERLDFMGFLSLITSLGEAAGKIWGVYKEISTSHCDGLVASDVVVGRGQDLDRLTANNGVYPYTKDHPGYESATFCGDHSFYAVTWSIRRV